MNISKEALSMLKCPFGPIGVALLLTLGPVAHAYSQGEALTPSLATAVGMWVGIFAAVGFARRLESNLASAEDAYAFYTQSSAPLAEDPFGVGCSVRETADAKKRAIDDHLRTWRRYQYVRTLSVIGLCIAAALTVFPLVYVQGVAPASFDWALLSQWEFRAPAYLALLCWTVIGSSGSPSSGALPAKPSE